MQIRRLVAADAVAYWEMRNRGLAEFPDAFTTTYEEGLATPAHKLALRFGGEDCDDFVMGAFSANDALAGCAGFQREHRLKNRHKGTLIGMYVIAEFRGQHIGRLLLAQLVEAVRALEGMEQLNLTVTLSNASARALYLQAGFVTFGMERRALKGGDRYHDKEHMVLML